METSAFSLKRDFISVLPFKLFPLIFDKSPGLRNAWFFEQRKHLNSSQGYRLLVAYTVELPERNIGQMDTPVLFYQLQDFGARVEQWS